MTTTKRTPHQERTGHALYHRAARTLLKSPRSRAANVSGASRSKRRER
jgi:hypothetical protein